MSAAASGNCAPDVGYWATYYKAAEGLMSGGM